jgi:hypothetical protein
VRTRTALIAVVVGLVVLGAARSPTEMSDRSAPVRLAAQTQLQHGDPVLSAAPQPAPPPPVPAPTYSHPAPTYPRPAPVQTYPRAAPAPVYPRPAPVQTYPRAAPTYPRPAPGRGPEHQHPGYQHPAPVAPVYPQPVPGYPRGHPTPTRGYPAPAPVQPRAHPVPVPVQPRPVPVSPRPGQTLVQVPRVIGSGLYVAEQMLHDRGLTVGSVSTQYSGATPGAVVRSNPPAFTSLPVGSAVNLVVAMPQ